MADNEREHLGTPHPNAVEQRLGAVETRVGELGRDVGALREEVGGLRGEVGELRGEVGELRGEVQTVRVLAEDNQAHIKQVIELSGARFDRIEKRLEVLDDIQEALRPLREIHMFVRSVAHDHEQRIRNLERHTGLQP